MANELMVKATDKEAALSAAVLVGSYPNAKIREPKVYLAELVRVFSKHPADIHEQARNRLTEACKFPPSAAELTYALKQLMKPRQEAARESRQQEETKQIVGRSYRRMGEEQAAKMFQQCKQALAEPKPSEPVKVRPNRVHLSDERREEILSGLIHGGTKRGAA